MAAQVEVQTGEVGRAVAGGRLLLSPLTDSSNKSKEIPQSNQSHIITPEPSKPAPGPKPRLTPKPFAVEKNPTIKPILAPKPQPKPRPESTRLAGSKPELPSTPKPQQPVPTGKPRVVSTNPSRPAPTNFKAQNKLNTGHTIKPAVQPFKPVSTFDPEEISKPTPVAAGRKSSGPRSLAYSKSLKKFPLAEWPRTTKREGENDQGTTSKGGAPIARAKSMGSLNQLCQEEEEQKEKAVASVPLRPQPRTSRQRPESAVFFDNPSKTEAPVPAPRWGGRRPLSADLTSKFESIGLSLHRKSPQANTKENTPEEKALPKIKTDIARQDPDGAAKPAVSADQSDENTEEKTVKDTDENKRGGSIKSRISLLLDSSSCPSAGATGQGSDLNSPAQVVPETEPPVGVKQLIKQLTEDVIPTQSPIMKPALKPRPLPLDLTKRFSTERSPDLGGTSLIEAIDRYEMSKDPQRMTEDSAVTHSEQWIVDLTDSQEQLKSASTPESIQTFSFTSEKGGPAGEVQTVRASLFENIVERHSVLVVDDTKPVKTDLLNSPSFKRESSEDEGTLVTATYKEPVAPSSPLRVVHAFDTVQAVEETRAVSENIPTAQWEDKAATLRSRRSEGSRVAAEVTGSALAATPEQHPRYLRVGALHKWTTTSFEKHAGVSIETLKESQKEEDFDKDRDKQREADKEEVVGESKRLKRHTEDQPKPKATYFALTAQIQDIISPVDSGTNKVIPTSPSDTVSSLLGSSQGKILSVRRNPSLDEAFGKISYDHAEESMMRSHKEIRSTSDGQTTEETIQVQRNIEAKIKELEREKQRPPVLEQQAQFAKINEREMQQDFVKQRQKETKVAEERERERQKVDREKMRKQEKERKDRQRQREEERQRELDREKHLLELQKEKQKREELELERQQLLEFERQKQKEKERQQAMELEQRVQREKIEREKAEKLKQAALEQETSRLKELEKERERQREMEKERQKELERERQRQLDIERQELENQRLRQEELEKERLRKELERQQRLEFEKQKQKEKERQQAIEVEQQMQREKVERERAEKLKQAALEQEMLRLREIEKEKERQMEMEKERQKELERERQRELERQRQRQKDLERERQRQLDIERQELENQRLRQEELEKERQRKELEAIKEMERRRLLEFEKQKQAEKERQTQELEHRLREEAEKMRQIAKQQEAERKRMKDKQERAKSESSPLRPKVVDLDSVFRNEPVSQAAPQRSDLSTRWKEPSPRTEESYKPAILDIDSFTSPTKLPPSRDLFSLSDFQGVDLSLGNKSQHTPERDVSWKVPPQTGFSNPVWTSPQDPWQLWSNELSVDKPVAEPRKSANKVNPEQVLVRQEERQLPPQRHRSTLPDELLLFDPFSPIKTGSPPSVGVSSSLPAEMMWITKEPQRQDSRAEGQRYRRSQGSQDVRMRSRSVSRRSASSSSALDGKIRSRSAHREQERHSWVQEKQHDKDEKEGKDSETPVHDTDSQYGTWETGLRTDDSLTPGTPTSESNLSPSPRKPTPPHTPGERGSQSETDTVDSLLPSSANQPLSFPDAPSTLLDNSVLRAKTQLARKRAPRTRPSRAARQSAALAEGGGSTEDWLYRDSTEPKVESKNDDSDSEEQNKEADVSPAVSSQPQRVALFPGMDPSALKAQLKKRGDSDSHTDGPTPSPSQLSRSPKSPFLPQAARVLPMPGGKENGEEDSPQWLKELKSKKRLSQYESES